MQQLERFGSDSDAILAAIRAELRMLFTTLPAIVETSDHHVARAISAINGLVRQDDGTMQSVTMPPFDTAPVHYAGGGRVVSTHPVQSGDEGLLVFVSRALDSWHQAGGQQNPIDSRVHSHSDAVYLGGIRSDPNKLANVDPNAIHLRSKDGKQTRALHPDTGAHDKAVPASDSAADPFNSAETYTESKTHPNEGKSWRRKTPTKDHNVSLTDGGFSAIVQDLATGHTAGLGLTPSGGLSMPAGSAASNVGTLSGDLSGSLPSPNVVGVGHVSTANTLPQYASNAAARSAGVAVGKFYINTAISSGEWVVCVAH